VRGAADAAKPGEVVLLSPACASYDQFDDFEQRGDEFRRLVEELR
jgi:UDP-N-acetylmuramoylalanine--D-glutamate ligase